MTHFVGTGQVLAPGSVAVQGSDGEQVLSAKHILLATGSVPVELSNLPFDEKHIISSTEALTLEKVPERLVVIGGGAIGLELGSVWSRLGAQILVVEAMDQILPEMDQEMAQQLERLLKRQGLKFLLGAKAQAAAIEKGQVTLTIASRRSGTRRNVRSGIGGRGAQTMQRGIGTRRCGRSNQRAGTGLG